MVRAGKSKALQWLQISRNIAKLHQIIRSKHEPIKVSRLPTAMAILSKPRSRRSCYPWMRSSTKSVEGQIGGTYSNEKSNSGVTYSTRGTPHTIPFLVLPDIPIPELFAPSRCFESPSVVDITPSALKVILSSKLSNYRKEQLFWFIHDLIALGGCKEEGASISSKFVQHRIGKHTLADARKLE